MIKLFKQDEPDVLVRSGAQWLKIIEDKLHAKQVPTEGEKTRYRHPDIKTVLIQETHGKCAYCESFLIATAFGDVEHISPKSLKLADTFRWANLTLACDKCNTYKKDVPDILDPYTDEPNEYLMFIGAMVYALPDRDRGTITVRQLRLNRVELVQDRLKRLEKITDLIELIKATNNPMKKKVLLRDLLENETGDETEFAAYVRSFIATVMGPNVVVSQSVQLVSQNAAQ